MLLFVGENALVHLTLVLIASLLAIQLLEYLIVREYEPNKWTSSYYSSIWCHGANHTNRRCRLSNFCYKGDTKHLVFIHHQNSIIHNVPEDRFNPSLAVLSSVQDHNQYYFNYVTIDAQYFSKLVSNYNVRFIKDKTFFYSRFKPDNLMHLLHDDILPIFWTLKESGWMDYVLFFLDLWPEVENIKFNKEIYDSLFDAKNIIISNHIGDNELVCFNEATVGMNQETVWYQYGFRKPQGALKKNTIETSIIKEAIHHLQNKLFSNMICPEKEYGMLISRKRNRKIINEDEVIHFLNRYMEMIKIDFESNDSILRLIQKASCAKLLIGVHGSGLILSMFMKSGSHMIEIFPYGINADNYTPYKTLCKLKGINYYNWTNNHKINTFPHPEYPQDEGGVEDYPFQIKSSIQNLDRPLDVHLCCNNPYWLYRIFQDTSIHLEELSIIIQKIVNKTTIVNTTSTKKLTFFPGPVEEIKCEHKEDGYVITWNKPWNLDYIPAAKVSYDILYEEKEKATIETTRLQYLYLTKSNEYFDFWIKCNVDGNKGPFEHSNCLI